MNTSLQNSTYVDTQSLSLGAFTAQVYAWMVSGLIVTFGIAFAIMFLSQTNSSLYEFLSVIAPIAIILQFIVVLVLSFIWRKLNSILSIGLFWFYSATMGVLLGLIFLGYTLGSIFAIFAATAGVFLIMAAYGYFTKQDLTRWGQIAIFGLVGLIVASIINFILFFIIPGFAQSFQWILSYIGIAIFLVLIAYDAQKIKQLGYEASQTGETTKYAVQGALALYLDFINLFIRLLIIFGKKR
jgi:FtsH-binding integral membrane protein